jgi:NAD(P)-dependent dehydrogenase (short-subunit alcohol dehydrogenase family)
VDVLGQQRRLRPQRRVQQAGLGAPAQHARARRDRPEPPDQAVTARHAGTRLRPRLNIASVGAYQPSPTYASYSAAKSFILNFTEALSYELRGSGVRATALSRGIVATEFLQVSGQRMTMMDSPTVARLGVDAC